MEKAGAKTENKGPPYKYFSTWEDRGLIFDKWKGSFAKWTRVDRYGSSLTRAWIGSGPFDLDRMAAVAWAKRAAVLGGG